MMAIDPRKTFTVRNCPIQNIAIQAAQSSNRGIIDSIVKIGNLEILNDIGAGGVAEGLRVLGAVSDSVRTGGSVIPGMEGSDTYNSALGKILSVTVDTVDKGARAVLDVLGLGGVIDTIGGINPAAANNALGQAKALFEKIKQGELELSDIPEILSDLQNLEMLAKKILKLGGIKGIERDYKDVCGASPYAMDLIRYAPKFNFMFVVEVILSDPYREAWGDIGNHMAFVVKYSSRPSIEFDHEDINMFNFRTKVPKRTIYQPIKMSFYDDNVNAAHLLYTAYMRAMSPIANMVNNTPQTDEYEISGMKYDQKQTITFGSGGPALGTYSASLGTLLDNAKSIIQHIKLYHIFDYGRLMNIYNFYNPRILSFSPSDLDMTDTGNGAEFEFEFAYDGLFIEPGFDINLGGEENIKKITGGAVSANYVVSPLFTGDPTSEGELVSVLSQQKIAPSAQVQMGGGRQQWW